MEKKKIKLIIAFLSFVILILWCFPTLIYNFDKYCLSYIKEEIIESTPNVYNLIFGGKVGRVKYGASFPAIIIFLLHISLLLISLFGNSNDNGKLNKVIIAFSIILCSFFFSEIFSKTEGIEENEYFTSFYGVGILFPLIIYVINIVLALLLLEPENNKKFIFSNNKKIKKHKPIGPTVHEAKRIKEIAKKKEEEEIFEEIEEEQEVEEIIYKTCPVCGSEIDEKLEECPICGVNTTEYKNTTW